MSRASDSGGATADRARSTWAVVGGLTSSCRFVGQPHASVAGRVGVDAGMVQDSPERPQAMPEAIAGEPVPGKGRDARRYVARS